MPKLACTPHLRAVGPTAACDYAGANLGELLDTAAGDWPRLKDYVLDDQGRLRKHIAVFIDGVMRPREEALGLALTDQSEVYVFQALSGG
jgi:hypothetical protein